MIVANDREGGTGVGIPEFDVLVVGAGHAGCEAAAACARLGVHTGLLTVNLHDTAKMSCNPAIGGIAKGHMVREIDAVGGLMGRVTDLAGIQFKVLNRGRGPAVWSPRAQCDKALYSLEMGRMLDGMPDLTRLAGVANHVRLEGGRVAGVELADGRLILAKAVVITPGTFLNGVIHIGPRQLQGGRIGEHAARALSECLAELGLARGRLKTGTPPRLRRDTIDWDALVPQRGDDPPVPFSHWTDALEVDQVLCHRTRTNVATHDVIRRNMRHSPLYSGAIKGTGPRYCPSIEDKVVKFPERTSHHVVLEPEGRDVEEVYVNGVSSSMPEDVQREFIRTMTGLQNAELIRPGYAVEYDFVSPHQLEATLEVKHVRGLFLAGQICGTSGYEEAAAQGLVAGINAARQVKREGPFILRRDQAYVGVLVDDLVTKEHHEPYRMFTSAAEHRLILRADNADERLAEIGHRLGLLDAEQVERVRVKYAALCAEEKRLSRVYVTVPAGRLDTVMDEPDAAACDSPAQVLSAGGPASDDVPIREVDQPALRRVAARTKSSRAPVRAMPHKSVSALEVLARPDGGHRVLSLLGVKLETPEAWADSIEIRTRYRGYIDRQQRHAARAAKLDQMPLDDGLWKQELRGLSREAVDKLRRWRPRTVGQASRIAGVSPSDVAMLLVYARRFRSLERTASPSSMRSS